MATSEDKCYSRRLYPCSHTLKEAHLLYLAFFFSILEKKSVIDKSHATLKIVNTYGTKCPLLGIYNDIELDVCKYMYMIITYAVTATLTYYQNTIYSEKEGNSLNIQQKGIVK